jgi:hypothetical protein
MKKFTALLLAFLMLFSLVACGGNEEAPDSTLEAKLSQGLRDVTVTLPASFVEWIGDGEPVDWNETYNQEGIKEVIENADGSVSIVMTTITHMQMLREMKLSIDESISEIVDDEATSFLGITYNSDLTVFDFTVNKAQYENSLDAVYVAMFPLLPSLYQVFAGTNPIQVTINLVDADTNEVFDTIINQDVYND